ncbi:DUF3298 and DUF4163 domain-containing protein [Parabacteroides sp. PF5-9]|uniref:DUF3298 and DUF4163 domain-containing protein n=1 Tax=Parabacteroides sp. PF5-9 TaxID=1742404 RepID=UPI0024754A51|nr:DUF3298 and DUF4163 domain-containing protein [Parabacteroides sp. PF5-9]MDH6358078.1 hypothetical protein [Parabacteroides sp. PF5-9]
MKTQLHKGFLVVLLIMGIAITSCRPGTKTNTENDIRFDSITVEKTYHLLDNPQNPNCNLQIKFIYPNQYTNKEILKKIQESFLLAYLGEGYESLSPQQAVSQYTEDYLTAYKDLENDYQDELKNASEESPVGGWFSYYEMSNNEIVYNQNDILSYTVYFENYTGGAHGAHSFMNHVINLKTGDDLTEENIFIDGFQDALAQLLVDQIARQNEATTAKELEDMGFFSIDEIYPNGNFLVDHEGITYSFNEYEIAAYVVGVTNVKLSYKEILHLLREESPISHLIN